MTTSTALLLNADLRPLRIIPWVRALCLILDDKAELLQAYDGRMVRSPSTALPWPAVVRLRRWAKAPTRVRFSRQNVLARDGYRCAYCGLAPRRGSRPVLEDLTLDHVVPRAQARRGRVRLPGTGEIVPVTSWRNVVTACRACNHSKADRTPAQAGMPLARWPRAPNPVDAFWISIVRVNIPDEWKLWLPEGSGWRGYWSDELEPS